MPALHIVNPADRDTSRWSRTHRYVLWFGASGSTYLMCWAHSLEQALETCADWLADNAPGLIYRHDDPYLKERLEEECEERGFTADDIEWSDLRGDHADAVEAAESDLTPTDSGYIPSDEWGIVFDECASRSDVKAWIAELEARHYSAEPVVQVG